MKRNDAIKMALEALKENHKWHKRYDDYDGYPESELCECNTKAIAALSALPVQDESVAWAALQEIIDHPVSLDNLDAFNLKRIAVDALTSQPAPASKLEQLEDIFEAIARKWNAEDLITAEQAVDFIRGYVRDQEGVK